MKCIFCLNEIKDSQASVGAGDGTGQLFVHLECWPYLLEAKNKYYKDKRNSHVNSKESKEV